MEIWRFANWKLNTPATNDNSLSPSIKWYKTFYLIFKGRCLKQNTCSQDLNYDFTLKECLFGDVKLAENADADKYIYSGYSIGFDLRSEFPFSDGSVGKNAIIFGVDMSLSVHIDNKEKDILILGLGPTKKDPPLLNAVAC